MNNIIYFIYQEIIYYRTYQNRNAGHRPFIEGGNAMKFVTFLELYVKRWYYKEFGIRQCNTIYYGLSILE